MLTKAACFVGMAALLLVVRQQADAEIVFGDPTPLPAPINSGFWDAATSISADGRSLFFISQRPGGQGSVDIWMTAREALSAPWTDPINVGQPVNTGYVESAPSISPDGKHLFFHDANPFGIPPRPGGLGTYDIWMASREDPSDPFGFGSPVPLSGPVNSPDYMEAYPNISADGTSLYFMSTRPRGGGGSADIWVATRPTPEDDWGTPVALGPTVNSSSWDGFPNISANGLCLLFYSNRPGGYGGLDIWMTTRADSSNPLGFGPPVNLGPVVNTLFYEIAPEMSRDFSAPGSTLYFSRNDFDGSGGTFRDGWGGTFMIYETTVIIPEPRTLVLAAVGTLALLAYGWQRRRVRRGQLPARRSPHSGAAIGR